MSLYRKYNYTQVDRRKYRPLQEIKYNKVAYDKSKNADFDRGVYNVTQYNLVNPDEDGYHTDDILRIVNSGKREYLNIINIGVGQGKTTAIYKLIRQYFDQGYKIIVASPFHTLVEKDYAAVTNGNASVGIKPIPRSQVFNFSKLKKYRYKTDHEELAKRDVHIMTINMLLGNAGQENLKQSLNKRNYLRILQEVWRKHGHRVVIIMDEIHESIHNFRPDLIYNLHAWTGMVHQVFFVTATLTEPVKFVAYHTSLLTYFNIRVIEADRIRFPDHRMSNLDIYITSQRYDQNKKYEVNELDFIFDYMHKHGISIVHILSYSKKLAKNLKTNFDKRGKECRLIIRADKTTETFDPTVSTIGTTMKTGVDISDPAQLYIIILPSNPWISETVKGINGIFSDGIPSIVQAIARMRNGGRILIVTPRPRKLMKDSSSKYLDSTLPIHLKSIEDAPNFDRNELGILSAYWYKEWSRVKKWETLYKKYSEEFPNLPRLQYPSFEDFVISDGQNYLTNYAEQYGKHIIPYFIWAAMNDQFQNCRLDTIFFKHSEFHKFEIDSGNIVGSIQNFYVWLGENLLPEKNESYFRNWQSLFDRLKDRNVNGLKQKTIVMVDGERNDKYIDRSLFKQALLGLYFESTGGSKDNFTLGGYLLHQIHCAAQKKFKQNRKLEQVYRELQESLNEVGDTVASHFTEWLPKKLTIEHLSPELTIAFQRLSSALDHLWDIDPFLMNKAWNKPKAATRNEISALWGFWFREFVVGDVYRTDGKNRPRAIRNYVFRHQIRPENYSDLIPIY